MMIRLFFVCLLLFGAQVSSAQAFTTGYIDVKTAQDKHSLFVQFATTPQQQAQGLMNRTTLEPYQGMVFDFHTTQHVSMWMKNTILSLDMLFIDEGGHIIKIEKNTVPYSQNIIQSDWPVRYVLEIAAGMSEALNIKQGDRVLFLN